MKQRELIFKGCTPIVAIDCERVQTNGFKESLARVSIVNYNGDTIYDKYVLAEGEVTDY
jgi:hypothetical protein